VSVVGIVAVERLPGELHERVGRRSDTAACYWIVVADTDWMDVREEMVCER
jgi:hypothetical protein